MMPMGAWKARVIAKSAKGRTESGRSKGLVPPAWAKHCAKAARSYKTNPRYDEWCSKCNGDKIKWNKQ